MTAEAVEIFNLRSESFVRREILRELQIEKKLIPNFPVGNKIIREASASK